MPRSGSSLPANADYRCWPIATEIHVPWHVRYQVKSGLVVLNVSFVARVQGFGCRPMEMVQLAPGPASESRQRTNPRVMCAESAALNYGDFAAGSCLLRLD
jgi:hypothetical protein